MTTSTHKAEENIFAKDINDGNPATWVSLAKYREYVATARAGTVSPLDDVTIQLRKATNSSGANATNHGSAVTAAGFAATSVRDDELGNYNSDPSTPFTHVSATISDEASPNTVHSVCYLTGKRA